MWLEVIEQVALQSLTQSVRGLFKSLNLSMNKIPAPNAHHSSFLISTIDMLNF